MPTKNVGTYAPPTVVFSAGDEANKFTRKKRDNGGSTSQPDAARLG